MLRYLSVLALSIAIGPATAQTISFAPVALYDAGASPGSLCIADLNSDGFPDVVVNDSALIGRVVVLLNNGDGTFATRVGYGTRGYAVLATGDLDGDGDLDIAAGAERGLTYWYENDATGVLTEHALPDRTTTSYAVGIALLDYDDDGRLDVGIVASTAEFEYAHNDGAGVFSEFNARRLFIRADNLEKWPTAVDAVDLDGDGVQEFVVASHAPRSFIRLDWNGHHFKPTVMHDVGRVDSVAYGELDGYPGLDAVFTHGAPNPESNSDGLWIACNDGTGALEVCERLRSRLQLDYPEAVAVGDFDSDGRDELVASIPTFLQSVAVVRRGDDDIWSTATMPFVALGALHLAVADVDRDDKPDIVAVGRAGVAILLNTTP